MLRIFIKKEILEAILSLRSFIATLLCVILIPLTTYVNIKEYEKRQADFQQATQLYLQRSKGKINMDFSAEGYRSPSPLSIFSVGLEYFLPNKIATSRSGFYQASNDQGIDNPQSLLFGKVDLLFNVSIVISLLVFTFTFNAISGEKEEGTLRLVISNSVPRWKVVLAKVIGSYTVILVPFFVAILVSIIVINTSGRIQFFSTAIFPAFSFIIAVTLLFILVLINIGILISTLTRRSTTSIIILLFIWTALVLLVPKISPMISEIIYPVESQQVFNSRKLFLREDYDRELSRQLATLYQLHAVELGVDPNRVFTRGSNDKEMQLLAVVDSLRPTVEQEYEKQMNEELKKLDDEYTRRRNTQEAIAKNLSRMSPVSCYMYVISEICATGALEIDRFKENATQYQAQVKEDLYDKFTVREYRTQYGSARSVNVDPGFNPSTALTPQLQYQHVTLEEGIKSELIDVLLLLLYGVIFFAVTYVSFLRYDVR